jgi:hypothetical protein
MKKLNPLFIISGLALIFTSVVHAANISCTSANKYIVGNYTGTVIDTDGNSHFINLQINAANPRGKGRCQITGFVSWENKGNHPLVSLHEQKSSYTTSNKTLYLLSNFDSKSQLNISGSFANSYQKINLQKCGTDNWNLIRGTLKRVS